MYYIDFDNTLYETGKLTKDILSNFAKTISKEKALDMQLVLDDINKSFNSATDNFFSFAKKLSKTYSINYNLLYENIIDRIITNGKSYVFQDALDFLKKLKDIGEDVAILTYVANSQNLSQQAIKLTGSGILDYVSEVYSTTKNKFELEIDYKNNIFIDDNPRDLEGLYNAGARKIYRITKPSNEKRNSIILNISENIPTYVSFEEISVNKKELQNKGDIK